MRLSINQALFEAGGITTYLREDEVRALEVGVDVQRSLVLGNIGPADDVLHNLPATPADFLSYDPLIFMRRAGPNDQGEYEETWTSEQVAGFAAATYAAAKMKHALAYRPHPDVSDPILSTALAIVGADSEAAADQAIAGYQASLQYNPLEDAEASNTPGRRVLLGFEAATAALMGATNYAAAEAIVNAHNEAALV